jgi:hypothetical protein
MPTRRSLGVSSAQWEEDNEFIEEVSASVGVRRGDRRSRGGDRRTGCGANESMCTCGFTQSLRGEKGKSVRCQSRRQSLRSEEDEEDAEEIDRRAAIN